MKTRDRTLFLATAVNNKFNVALHALAGIALIGSTIGFSTMIALYFGFDVMGLKHRPQFSFFVQNKTFAISLAIAFSLIALISRIGQTFIEAKVTVDQERWFAEMLRSAPNAKYAGGNIPRASNYYGRIATISMRTVSIVCVLFANLIGLLILIPHHYGLAGVGLILCCSSGLYLIMRTFNIKMADSTTGMFKHSRIVSEWKLNASKEATDELGKYFKAYLNRIFISSYFSFTPLIFSLLFAVFILFAHEFNIATFDLGEIFIVFTLLRSYLALVGSFFGSLVQAAALLPAVRPYAPFIPGVNLSPEQLEAIKEKQIASGTVFDEQSMEEF
ncbi:hypothetical protein [Microvirga solisilvae]|uniref:hypothetical protein n=1 Tax=Microvirga solisilvae TaxID=2919498 RepID=UPI001FAF975F|nr:hypothetical protein [Microvirga solisilvae]